MVKRIFLALFHHLEDELEHKACLLKKHLCMRKLEKIKLKDE
jgi:hypothetical protein